MQQAVFYYVLAVLSPLVELIDRGEFVVRNAIVAILVGVFLCVAAVAHAQGPVQVSKQSRIVVVEGDQCIGQNYSRAQAEEMARNEAKKRASERVKTNIASNVEIKNGKLLQALVKAYAAASVSILEEMEQEWQDKQKGTFTDECYRIKIKAEVVPASVAESKIAAQESLADPTAPLTVQVWTSKKVYHLGDNMHFYFRANKPFYAKAVYVTAEGQQVQINPYKRSKYYQGGVTYRVPDDSDNFVLKITPPLGKEKLVLYTSTQPMDQYKGQAAGDMFVVAPDKKLGLTTRGLTILQGVKPGASGNKAEAEFAEAAAHVTVER